MSHLVINKDGNLIAKDNDGQTKLNKVIANES